MHPNLLLNDSKLTQVNNHKQLGLTISNNMSWSSHINEILAKAEKDSQLCEGQKIFYQEVALTRYTKALNFPYLIIVMLFMILVPCMKVNNLTNCKGKPAYCALVHPGSPAMKNY